MQFCYVSKKQLTHTSFNTKNTVKICESISYSSCWYLLSCFSAVAVYEINSSPLKGSHTKCVVLPHCLCLILGKVKSRVLQFVKILLFWNPKNYLPNTFLFEWINVLPSYHKRYERFIHSYLLDFGTCNTYVSSYRNVTFKSSALCNVNMEDTFRLVGLWSTWSCKKVPD